MSLPESASQPPNPGTELAKERNRAAEERTLMAWIRTCLALISFGFGIERIVAVLHQELGDQINPLRLSRILGLSFVALGTGAMLVAAIDHRQQLRRIQRNQLLYRHRHSTAMVVAVVLTVLGAVAFIGMLVGPSR
jgi:putative membrane protein